MKMNKWFMLGMVGLAFTACSNEEEVENANLTPKGNGAVSVKIVKPAVTKTLSPGPTVDVTGNITITLTGKKSATSQSDDYTETITIASNQLSGTTELKFWNVYQPTKITASINGGRASYEAVAITSKVSEEDDAPLLWQVAPASAPAYGETTTFTLTQDEDSPELANDNNGSNNGTEAGANAGDDEKVYSMYEASVVMAIPMARLEIGSISYQAPTEGESIYESLTYTGCYLDHYATNGAEYKIPQSTENNGIPYFPSVTVPDDANYQFEANAGAAGQNVADLKYAAASNHNFITTPITDAGSFNFFAGATNPQFKLYFKNATFKSGVTGMQTPRYAIIKKYLKEGKEINLENGHIYQITGVILDSDNFIPNEEGEDIYGVVVTVTEAVWSVESIDAEWAD